MSELAVKLEVIEGEVIEPEEDAEPELDFEARVERLMGMMKDDPTVRDRMLTEMYVMFNDFERMTRTMALNGGPIQMLKAMLKGG